MVAEKLYVPHPEGLTEAQERLADFLFDSKTIAPVNRRRVLSDGSFKFYKVERPTSPIDFAQEGEFALKMHETKPEAPLSPVYINLRNLPVEIVGQIGAVLTEMGVSETPDYCAGIPKAGIPLAQAFSERSGIPVVDAFEKEQTEQGRRIVASEGDDDGKGKKLLIVDDLATRGDTKLESIRAAEAMGYRVTELIVLVDRQQGAVAQLSEAGYRLRAAFTMDQLLQYGVRTGRISQERYAQVRAYLGLGK